MIQLITMIPINKEVIDEATVALTFLQMFDSSHIHLSSIQASFAFQESQTMPKSQVPPTLPSVK